MLVTWHKYFEQKQNENFLAVCFHVLKIPLESNTTRRFAFNNRKCHTFVNTTENYEENRFAIIVFGGSPIQGHLTYSLLLLGHKTSNNKYFYSQKKKEVINKILSSELDLTSPTNSGLIISVHHWSSLRALNSTILH
jgi:hypothetical protein